MSGFLILTMIILAGVLVWRLLVAFGSVFIALLVGLVVQPQTRLGKLAGTATAVGICYGFLRLLQWAFPA